jgi:hypothetical protein
MQLFIIETINGAKHIVIAEDMVDAKNVLRTESTTFNLDYDDIRSVRPYSGKSIRIS